MNYFNLDKIKTGNSCLIIGKKGTEICHQFLDRKLKQGVSDIFLMTNSLEKYSKYQLIKKFHMSNILNHTTLESLLNREYQANEKVILIVDNLNTYGEDAKLLQKVIKSASSHILIYYVIYSGLHISSYLRGQFDFTCFNNHETTTPFHLFPDDDYSRNLDTINFFDNLRKNSESTEYILDRTLSSELPSSQKIFRLSFEQDLMPSNLDNKIEILVSDHSQEEKIQDESTNDNVYVSTVDIIEEVVEELEENGDNITSQDIEDTNSKLNQLLNLTRETEEKMRNQENNTASQKTSSNKHLTHEQETASFFHNKFLENLSSKKVPLSPVKSSKCYCSCHQTEKDHQKVILEKIRKLMDDFRQKSQSFQEAVNQLLS